MKIVVLNHTDVRVELLNVVDSLCPDEIEEFLYDRGFDVSNISWLKVPSDVHDYVPIKFHEFDVKDNGEETHSERTARLKNFTIYDNVQDIKRREQEELADVMNYCIQMSQVLNIDIIEVINNKMNKNEKKYPIEKAKGVSTKYDKL